jgi:hypothetical protein
MSTRRYVVAALAMTGLALGLVTATPASGAVGTSTSFVVDTQFVDGPSDIVSATGDLASCTEVLDLGGTITQVTRVKVQFSGEKVLACGAHEVVVHYDAQFNGEAGRRTFGDWYVVSSTLPGVQGGSGTLKGDNRTCTLEEGSEGCITDTFTGATY